MRNLENMSKEDLAKERAEAENRLKQIEKAQAEYHGRRVKELRSELDAMLAREGFSVEDVYGGKGGKRAPVGRTKGPAKYRHPENPDLTWSGRGRQPGWFKEAIASGESAFRPFGLVGRNRLRAVHARPP